MRYNNIDNKLFKSNRERLMEQVNEGSLLIINSNDETPRNGDQYYPFRQHSDLFYLTGIEQEKTILIMFKDHPLPAFRQILFIIRPDETLETWEGRKLRAKEASDISGIVTIKYLDETEAILRDLMVQSQRVYLNRNEYPKFFPDVVSRDDRFIIQLQKQFPLHRYERLSPLLWKLRMVKSKEEITLMQKAMSITGDAFNRVLETLKPGIKEYEAEAEIIYEFTRQGATHGYQPIIAQGINGCSLHYHHNDSICQDGQLLLMDFGAEYANYGADCSRTIPVNGRFTLRQRACYEAVLRVLKKAIQLYIPGNTINTVNQQVNLMIQDEMIALGLFTQEDVNNQPADKPCYAKYFMHGTAHFLGLDVHDVGGKDIPFESGMILTCEPGLYIRDEAIGIRIEDNILVGATPTNLTDHIIKEAEAIEKRMQY
ncbi:MAG TPA: X-Pro aminopeptidase [Bacteroidales bacterium]|nr:MAG: hypothetical protein A2X11_14520 [Bacteroidetes bacterium GWE2_42_24]OFY31567.1 MAG: hypothetical protein A2X09_08260 [Bacteroidetes bacterium GWF2_43_11]PKP26117.1 MAG: X-Pro aminopeptidase [Bacteroidetes bacterium HGW-Bacteroidetes-22]HAQ65718.1 X-Pro aminopeptidase [Bacteroidales bacterium]HBZ67182.1 X-Pro aminopeptidase [Bacteroidales bacterium]